MLKHVSLELGGKNAAIVFEDANLFEAIPELIRAGYLNQGEICLAMSRIFVHELVYQKFLDDFSAAARGLRVGSGPKAFLGALVSKEHLNRVKNYVRLAIDEGGTVVCGETVEQPLLEDYPGGQRGRLNDGYFMAPTVITNLSDDSSCMQEEIFGPVVCISKFGGDEDAVAERVNGVKYGLCASIWTENVRRMHRMASKLEVGTVWQNCWLVRNLDMPFGGCKESGIGREGIYHSFEAYTELKTCCLKIPATCSR